MSKAKGAPAPTQPQLQDYTLPIPHEHAGTLHPAGTVLALYPDQIDRIEAHAKTLSPTAA